MPHLEWSDEYVCGIASVDAQHKQLFALLDQIQDAICAHLAQDELIDVFDELIEYTLYHFSHEEEFFKNAIYPRFAEHKCQHEVLTAQVLKYRANLNMHPERFSPSKLLSFFQDWLTQHIMIDDRSGCRFVLEGSTSQFDASRT